MTPPTVCKLEPVTTEDVLEIVRIEKPKGVIVQYGGQTPLKLARALEAAGVPVIGTSPDAIDRAEDRERFQHAVDRLKLKQPANATVTAIEQAVESERDWLPAGGSSVLRARRPGDGNCLRRAGSAPLLPDRG